MNSIILGYNVVTNLVYLFALSADKLDAACSLIMALSFGRFGQWY